MSQGEERTPGAPHDTIEDFDGNFGPDMPNLHTVVLPSRAILLSWRTQTLPARRVALDDASEHYSGSTDEDSIYRSMALAGLIADAAQPLEDFAYLATAWNGALDRQFGNQPNWVRATTYDPNMASTFWDRAHKLDEDQLALLAGFRGRDPETKESMDLLEPFLHTKAVAEDVGAALEAAHQATIARLKRLLPALRADWRQLGSYFHAFKHGGLVLDPGDVTVVERDENDGSADPQRTLVGTAPALLVWKRRQSSPKIDGDLNGDPDRIAEYVLSVGRLALDLLDALVESRLALFDALAFNSHGEVIELRPLTLPWAIWLREEDLTREQWELVGAGPRITWIKDDPEESGD